MNFDNTGKFIKKLREEKKWTQEQLASKIPLGREAISKWENGKSLPDISSLQKLSEIFSVNIDELLAGERMPKENITLKLYNERFILKKRITILVTLLILSLLLFFSYYFINLYKSINIYTVHGKGDNFEINSGLFVITKEKVYFNLGNVSCLNYDKTNKIEKVEVYYTLDDEQTILVSSYDENILLFDKVGYEEYFDMNNINSIIENMYVKIYYNDTNEIFKLSFTEDYVNDSLFFSKKPKVAVDSTSNDTNKEKTDDLLDVEEKMKLKFDELNKGYYYYHLKKDNMNIEIVYILSERTVNVVVYNGTQAVEDFYYFYNYNTLTYNNYSDKKYSFDYNKTYICKSGQCGSEKSMKEKTNYFIDLINNAVNSA